MVDLSTTATLFVTVGVLINYITDMISNNSENIAIRLDEGGYYETATDAENAVGIVVKIIRIIIFILFAAAVVTIVVFLTSQSSLN